MESRSKHKVEDRTFGWQLSYWGNSETSVRIQIYAAIYTYCIVAIIEHQMKLERNIYMVMRILGRSLLVKEHIKDLPAPEPEPVQIVNCGPTLDLGVY